MDVDIVDTNISLKKDKVNLKNNIANNFSNKMSLFKNSTGIGIRDKLCQTIDKSEETKVNSAFNRFWKEIGENC